MLLLYNSSSPTDKMFVEKGRRAWRWGTERVALSAPGDLSPDLEITTLSTRNARVVCRMLYSTYMSTLWMDEGSSQPFTLTSNLAL